MIRASIINIKNFLGVNRRDGADLVQNNEFFTLQNFYPKTKGLFYKREGSVQDLTASQIPGADRITAITRYIDPIGKRNTLYYCESTPGTTIIPDPDPGDFIKLSGAAASGALRTGVNTVYVTYVGRGIETAPVLLTAPNFIAAGYSINVGRIIDFPDGVQSANLYLKDSVETTPRFVGVIRGNGSSVVIKAPYYDARASTIVGETLPIWCDLGGNTSTGHAEVTPGAGNIQPGTYFISCAWLHYNDWSVADQLTRVSDKTPDSTTWGDQYLIVRVNSPNSSIKVCLRNDAGGDGYGSSYLHYFIGFKPPNQVPHTWVATGKCLTSNPALTDPDVVEIFDIYDSSNAQTGITYGRENESGLDTVIPAFFDPFLTTVFVWQANPRPSVAFIVKQDELGNLTEVMYSGSCFINLGFDPFIRQNGVTPSGIIHSFCLIPTLDDQVSFQSFVGTMFIANSRNLILQTDGYVLYDMITEDGTIQPGIPAQLEILKTQLCCTVKRIAANSFVTSPSKNTNQVYGCNVLDPYNWADAGAGTGLRFATIGDGFEDGVTALALFSFNSATDGPSAFLTCFKKASIWLLNDVPDTTATTTASANAISGRIGCIAPDTAVATNIGLVFLGSDGDVYLVSNTGGEPRRIGNRIRAVMEHLSKDEDLMKRSSACFHEGFYKLSFPSSLDSTTNDAEVWADLRTEQGAPITWCGPHLGLNIGKQIVFLSEGDQNERLCIVDKTASSAFLNDTSTFQDIGAPIVSVMEWKTSRIDQGMTLKRIFGMLFDVFYDMSFAHEAVIEGFADDQYTQQDKILSTGTATWDSSNFDQSNWGDARFFALPVMFGPTNLIGRTFKWRLTHANNAQFIIAAANIIGKSEKRLIV